MNLIKELNQMMQPSDFGKGDDSVSRLKEQLSTLSDQFRADKEMSTLVKMMQSLTDYLESRNKDAHPDALPALKTIAEQIDDLSDSDLDDDEEKKAVVAGQLAAYRELQDKIASNPSVSPDSLEELNEAILSIDWEISEETIQTFETVLEQQLKKFKPYKIHYNYLRIIYNVGRYVASRKAKAHTDSVSYLRSVFDNFQHLLQNTGLSVSGRKKLFKEDIRQFQEFKQKISSQRQKSPAPEVDTAEASEYSSVTPALTHIGQKSVTASDEKMVTLDTIPEIPDSSDGADITESDPVTPALSGGSPPPPPGKDVMDDLFSVKESPADELLDAIHLMDVHGPDQGQAMTMLNDSAPLSKGVKNFTPKRKENQPIPEIESRLDEFFSLEEKEPAQAVEPDLGQTDEDSLVDTGESDIPPEFEPPEEIVPFDHVEEENSILTDQVNQAMEILNRVNKIILSTQNNLSDQEIADIRQELIPLETMWEADEEKQAGLTIITRLLEMSESSFTEDKSGQDDSDISDEPGPENKTDPGFLGKIKGMFSS